MLFKMDTYFPNSFSGPKDDVRKYSESKFAAPSADVARFNSSDEDNFTQCGIFFRDVLKADERFRLVDNIASHIINAQEFLQVRFLFHYSTRLPGYPVTCIPGYPNTQMPCRYSDNRIDQYPKTRLS